MPAPSPAPDREDARPEDPFTRFYRSPIARLLARALGRTPIAAEQVALVQPFLAAFAGYFLTFADTRHLALAVLLFEARAILECTGEALARAQQKARPDRAAGWLSMAFLCAGILWHVHLHVTWSSAWGAYLSVNGALLLALLLLNGWFVRRRASRRWAVA